MKNNNEKTETMYDVVYEEHTKCYFQVQATSPEEATEICENEIREGRNPDFDLSRPHETIVAGITSVLPFGTKPECIYTHDEAGRIMDMFESILEKYGICVPSPEDDERDTDNDTGMYGSTYADLFDQVEAKLLEILNRNTNGEKVVPYEYSGKY